MTRVEEVAEILSRCPWFTAADAHHSLDLRDRVAVANRLEALCGVLILLARIGHAIAVAYFTDVQIVRRRP